MTLKEAMNSIKPARQALRQQAKQRWDQVGNLLRRRSNKKLMV